jgi:D-alanine-D-alanine ligase
MLIAITYNLPQDYMAQGFSEEEAVAINTNKTKKSIHNILTQLGHKTVDVGNIQALIKRLAEGERWDLVFNFADGSYGTGRESLIPALLDAYQIPYTFSDPLSLALCLNKVVAKRIVRDHNIPTAPFVEMDNSLNPVDINLPYPLYIKPVQCGRSFGISENSYIDSPEKLVMQSKILLEKFNAVLVEAYLPGREFTVGILGAGVDAKSIGVLEVVLNDNAESHGYTRTNKRYNNDRTQYKIADDKEAKEAERVALSSWRALKCKDAGRVDVRSDANKQPCFIEANPIAGLNPEFSDLATLAKLKGMTYAELIHSIIKPHIKESDVALKIKLREATKPV